jgi:hypothetical protein
MPTHQEQMALMLMMDDISDQQPPQSSTTTSTTTQDSSDSISDQTTNLNQESSTTTSAPSTNGDTIPRELQEFNPFTKLPFEMRCKIWSASFSKRHIDLDIRSIYADSMANQEDSEAPPKPFNPATLLVNRESNSETLRKYYAVRVPENIGRHSYQGWRDKDFSPGWVNPSLDSVFFRHAPAVGEFETYVKWFEHIASCIPGGLKGFRELEIRHVWLNADELDEDEEQTVEEKVAELFPHVLKFTGLKHVVLTADGESGFVPDDDDLEEFRRKGQEWLEERKEMFVGGVAPVVTARQFEDLYTGEPAFD